MLLDLEDKKFLPRRIFRLRAHVYNKIPWMVTYDIMNQLIYEGNAVEVEGNWLAHPYVVDIGDAGARVKEEHLELFARKQLVESDWLGLDNRVGDHGEDLIASALERAGYTVRRRPSIEYGDERMRPDMVCERENELPLCIEVKNILSDVILSPEVLREKSSLYEQLAKHFRIAREIGMVPILFAPFVDRSFYMFCDHYRGLYCQMLLQLLPPGEEELRDRIKEDLNFGNVRVVAEAPPNVVLWISRIRQMWESRYV